MYDAGGKSDAISRDMNSILLSSTFKHPSEGEFAKIKQLISSDPYPSFDRYSRNQNQNQYGEMETSLICNRSAPNSFVNLLNDNGFQEFLDPAAAASPEERRRQLPESGSRDVLQYSLSLTDAREEAKEGEIQKQDLRPPPVHGGGSRHAPTLPQGNNSGDEDNARNRSNLGIWPSTSSNLIRQSSSPARFLSSSTVGNGFDGTKGGSSSRLNNHISFSSSTRFLPQIDENGNDQMDDSSFKGLKRSRDGDFLQFQQDSVPCKIRAKRGFATHPRSIAERERRTRISERMKKLQELFPNMDKQMSIADMLDMAVDCIKDLQKEVQTLNDARGRCTCSRKQLQSGSTK